MQIFRILRRLFAASIVLYGVTLLFVLAFTLLQPLFEHENPKADLILVLGGGMSPDGTLHRSTTVRVDKGIDLFLSGAAPKIHFTGGTGHPDGPSAGAQMAAMAVEDSIPTSAISMETRSQSTLQNALFSQSAFTNAPKIILVTEGFHLARSWVSFKLFGANNITLIHARKFRGNNVAKGAKMVAREALAIWFNAVRYLLWHVSALTDMTQNQRDKLLK